MYKAVIFDFFGVFCAPPATIWFKETVPGYEAKLSAFQSFCTQCDLGKLSRADFNTQVSELTGVPIAEIVRGIEAQTVINDSLVAYVRTLKERYRITCLSNGSREWTLQVIDDHGLHDMFEQIVLSGDLGIVKPNPEIYVAALDKLGLPASQVIFVDDRKTNTDAAEALGIRSIVFTDTQAFVKDFETATLE
jgi:putative hydrolase of the HAD superfamily